MRPFRREVHDLIRDCEVIQSAIAQEVPLSADEIGVLKMCATELIRALQRASPCDIGSEDRKSSS